LTRTDLNNLAEALFVFLNLVLIDLSILSVQFLQEVVEVTLEPQRCVIGLLCRDVQPCFGLHVLLAVTILLK